MNIKNTIDKSFELEGNGEKIKESTSILINFTRDCCFNCLNGDKKYGNDYYNFIQCQNPNSNYRGLDNSSELVCNQYEG